MQFDYTKKKKIRTVRSGSIGGILFGLIFFAFGLLPFGFALANLSSSMHLTIAGEEATGRITEIDSYRDSDGQTMYTPVVEFLDNSGNKISFKHSFGSSSSAFSVGEEVSVLYPLNNPQKAKINAFFSLWGLPMILMLFGVIFGGVGGLIMYASIKSKADFKFLQNKGQRIKAEISATDFHKVDKGRDYWTINAQWHDTITNKIYAFQSDAIYINPQKYVTDEIDVIIDPDNPKRYVVDLSSLPEIVQ